MRALIVVLMALVLSGCSTKYETIPNKDISLKVRSIWVDVDYDSRVCKPSHPLPDLTGGVIQPIEGIDE